MKRMHSRFEPCIARRSIKAIKSRPVYMSNVFTRESPAVFRTLIERSHDPFYVVSPADGFRLVYVNPAAIEFLGYPREKLLGTTAPDWDASFSLEQLEGLWQELKRQGNLVFTTSIRKSCGEMVPLEVNMSHLIVEGEEFMAGDFRDATERKSAEAGDSRGHVASSDAASARQKEVEQALRR